jgi:hypothetical protein
MLLKGALHVHTTCSDGRLAIPQVIAAHRSLGFDFIALTDHDFLMRPDCYGELDRLESDCIIFPGVELTVFEKGYVHVGRICGDKETLHIFNHPSEMGLSPERAVERILSVAEQLPLDAVEITSKGFRTPEYDVELIPYPKVATDDSHAGHMIGRAWIEMDCARDRDAILRAIRAGEFWNCYANGSR